MTAERGSRTLIRMRTFFPDERRDGRFQAVTGRPAQDQPAFRRKEDACGV